MWWLVLLGFVLGLMLLAGHDRKRVQERPSLAPWVLHPRSEGVRVRFVDNEDDLDAMTGDNTDLVVLWSGSERMSSSWRDDLVQGLVRETQDIPDCHVVVLVESEDSFWEKEVRRMSGIWIHCLVGDHEQRTLAWELNALESRWAWKPFAIVLNQDQPGATDLSPRVTEALAQYIREAHARHSRA